MIDYTMQAGRLTVLLGGELDHAGAPRVRRAIDTLIAKYSPQVLAVDVGGLTFMDSSGLGVLMGRYKNMARRGGRVVIKNAAGAVERIFTMAGVYQVMEKE